MLFQYSVKRILAKNYNNIIDHDITEYKYIYNKNEIDNFEALKATKNRTRNKDFPTNWLKDLKKLLFTENIILVPADLEIRELLVKEKIDFTFIIPDINSKEILINRYKNRGNNEMFIKRAINQLQEWNKEFKHYKYKTIVISAPYTLENYLMEQNIL